MSAGRLVNKDQLVAVGNDTHYDWINIGTPLSRDGKIINLGETVNETFGGQASWSYGFKLHNNHSIGMSLTEQKDKADELGARLATVEEIQKMACIKAGKGDQPFS